MATIARYSLVLGLSLLVLQAPLQAQDQPPPQERAYEKERHLVETTLATIVSIIQEVTLQNGGHNIGDRLREMATNLNEATDAFMPNEAAYGLSPASADRPLKTDDLRELERLLVRLQEQLDDLRKDLRDDGEYAIARRLTPIADGLEDAVYTVRRLSDDTDTRVHIADADTWRRPDRTRRPDAVDASIDDRIDDAIYDAMEQHRDARRSVDERRKEIEWTRRNRIDWRDHTSDRRRASFDDYSVSSNWIGDFSNRWPFPENALYRRTPAIRYNRVEGLVLGVQRRKLEWDSWERGRIFGQVGYAFALKSIRYEVGAETRLGGRYGRGNGSDLKLGGAYHRNTTTNDLWKSSWAENSIAAFFFENDFFDYYETEGWTVYGVARLGYTTQLSAGYRSEEHRSMVQETTWSLFDGGGFRFNPLADEGELNAFVFALEGGHVRGLHSKPRGAAFRFEAEVGESLGGDFSFNRYLGDVRVYAPAGYASTLALRLRGGLAEGDLVPFQKLFSLGGIGSMRAYPQNLFVGTHMLLGNVEYSIHDIGLFDGILDDMMLSGFLDAGWVSDNEFDTFDFDDVIPSAGLGLGLADRTVRLELAWPLRDIAGSQKPTLWLRINPPF